MKQGKTKEVATSELVNIAVSKTSSFTSSWRFWVEPLTESECIDLENVGGCQGDRIWEVRTESRKSMMKFAKRAGLILETEDWTTGMIRLCTNKKVHWGRSKMPRGIIGQSTLAVILQKPKTIKRRWMLPLWKMDIIMGWTKTALPQRVRLNSRLVLLFEIAMIPLPSWYVDLLIDCYIRTRADKLGEYSILAQPINKEEIVIVKEQWAHWFELSSLSFIRLMTATEYASRLRNLRREICALLQKRVSCTPGLTISLGQYVRASCKSFHEIFLWTRIFCMILVWSCRCSRSESC